MKKWNLLESVSTPDKRVFSLHEHDGTYSIRIDGLELMSTRQHTSEERLAELGVAKLQSQPKAKVLIGGLGFGFTLKRTLACLPKDAKVVVVEIMPAVVSWNQNSKYKLSSKSLADPRVYLIERDVSEVIRTAKNKFNAILLDVDNGASGFSRERNKQLYQRKGLEQAMKALVPGGCLAIWSASEDPSFVKLMGKVGFTVEVERCKAHHGSGSWHWLFIGRTKIIKPKFQLRSQRKKLNK